MGKSMAEADKQWEVVPQGRNMQTLRNIMMMIDDTE
jgi:hypothetical protein